MSLFVKISKIFYGYRILVVLFFCLFIMGGCGNYTFSLFVRPLQDEFGWGRGEIMMAFTFFFLIMGGSGPIVGRLIIRYGARKVMAIGASIGCLGFISLTQLQNLGHFYASYVVIAIGISACGAVPATTVLSNWFKKRRGTAIGIMATGVPTGGVSLARVIGGHIIPNFGWETAYLILALIILAIIPMVLIVIKTNPSEMGLYPYGTSETELAEQTSNAPTPEVISLKTAFTTSTFRLMAVSFMIFGFVSQGFLQHQVPHLQDIGFSAATSAAVLSVWGLGSLSSHLFFGWLCDKIQAKYVLCMAFGLKLAAIVILINVSPTSPLFMLWIYAVLMGTSMAAGPTTSSILISNNFGLASYSIIFGSLRLATSTGSATGALFAGYMYDIMNTYHLAFTILLVLCIVAIPIALAIRRPALPSRNMDY
ncbi:MFS transporter [Chloroflexota bacterium]